VSRPWRGLLIGLPIFGLIAAVSVMALFFGSVVANPPDSLGGACTSSGTVPGPDGVQRRLSLDNTQLANARTIIDVGQQLGVPSRGLVVAIATALQESGLRNLDHGDRDSVGLFQQRPSSGWGTVAELTTPAISAAKFYHALLAVSGWAAMPLTQAAQAVQRSAFPFAYAKWESLATAVVAARASLPAGSTQTACIGLASAVLATGAVGDMLRAALAQQGKPYVFGATGPDAFDCSGLVVFAWRQAGYRLTVRTAAQMFSVSTPVPPGSEQPGDLLFGEFNGRFPGAGHVMIVVRPGLAVEAPHTGDVVKLAGYDPNAPGWRLGRLSSSVLLPVPGTAPVAA